MNLNTNFIVIDKTELKRVERIAKGPRKEIYRGTWEALPKGKEVAIRKWSLRECPPKLISELPSSGQLLAHPNILTTYGWCLNPGSFSTVTELMFQSLFQLNTKLVSKGISLDLGTKREIILGVSSGAAYAHSKGYVDLHLTSNNILLSEDLKQIKISDMGLSKISYEATCRSSGVEPTIRYRSPETFTREYAKIEDALESKKRTDAYGLGRVIGEIVTGQVPFANYSEAVAMKKIQANVQEPIPKHCPRPIVLIIQKCLNFTPQERPTTRQVKAELERPELDSYFLLGEKFAKKVSIISGKEGMKEMMRNVIFPIFLEINPELNYKLNI